MANDPRDDGGKDLYRRRMLKQIKAKQARKQKARREGERSVWFGLGMFGLVGWSVAVPTLIGIAVGVWLDTRYDTAFSWTLMLIVLGAALGCVVAGYWVSRESRGGEE